MSTIGPGRTAGPVPPRPRATITLTERQGGHVVVSTWDGCPGTAALVRLALGHPTETYELAPVPA
ncbi:hypothetical protein ACIBG7_18735 [Nonomuraea sp. NPDC050328]|uniref:hypothetical protein n=1 Tax=Nonomuraea sp. NPDC050328 TaxID=3364361 RepID=UPI0037ACDF6A